MNDSKQCIFEWRLPRYEADEQDNFCGRVWSVAARITPTSPNGNEQVLLYGGQEKGTRDFLHDLRLITVSESTITVTTPKCTPPHEGLKIVAGHRAVFTDKKFLVFGGVESHNRGKYEILKCNNM
jgi:hypothetical protein